VTGIVVALVVEVPPPFRHTVNSEDERQSCDPSALQKLDMDEILVGSDGSRE
jgi:hypothetical protein